MEEKFTISLIVSNQFGVLGRVAGLYAKRGYNIDSLAVGVTENPAYSRMTIVSTGDEYMREQVVRQLNKLYDVKTAVLLDKNNSVSVEHMLIKLRAGNGSGAELSELINSYGGKNRDFGAGYIIAEITGDSDKIDEFIARAAEFGILEVCRSGGISLSHGTEDILRTGDVRCIGDKLKNSLGNFLDNDGKLTIYPAKKKYKILSLFYLASKFESGRIYTEKEVNQILTKWHAFGDFAMLRRDLYDKFFLNRKPDGTAYWLEKELPELESFNINM